MNIVAENAVLVHANHCQCRSGQTFGFSAVMSRMLLWCKGGDGTVTVNGERYELHPDDFLMIPWRHSIRYEASLRTPFLLAGVHVIPDHRRNVPVAFEVAHVPDHPLHDSPYRSDTYLEGLTAVRFGTFSVVPDVRHLAEYCVLSFGRIRGNETVARDLGRLVLTTLTAALAGAETREREWPESLRRMVLYLRERLFEPLSLSHLSAASGLSPSAVGRLFVKHTGMTPVRYIAGCKLAHARGLLTTTLLPIAKIGARIGISDVSYFSKLFCRHVGCSPLRYRRREAIL